MSLHRSCPPDKFTAPANSTGTGMEFKFDRLGVRVPAVLDFAMDSEEYGGRPGLRSRIDSRDGDEVFPSRRRGTVPSGTQCRCFYRAERRAGRSPTESAFA